METEHSHNPEDEHNSKDISQEFLDMGVFEFLDFLITLKNEQDLSITVDWGGAGQARRLKAFVEEYTPNQKRSATIRATGEQYKQELNVFASGVKWERVDDDTMES